jgi:hypothetical protein
MMLMTEVFTTDNTEGYDAADPSVRIRFAAIAAKAAGRDSAPPAPTAARHERGRQHRPQYAVRRRVQGRDAL